MNARDGLIIGRTLESGKLILHRNYCHLSVFAPAGAGKSTSFCIPWLLTYNRGSTVNFDPKGELYKATAAKRKAMGRRTVRLDPFGVCGPGSDTFNPLDLIGDGLQAADDSRALSETMVKRGEERDPYWNNQAANALTGLTAFTVTSLFGTERSLCSVREIVTDSTLYDSVVAKMQAKGDIFRRLAGVLSTMQDKEKAGVLSTVNQHTTFLDSPAISASVEKSSFDAMELLKGNTDIFLILPPSQIEAQSRWLRLVFASFIRMIGQHGMAKGKECLMILDEAGQIGHMEAIEQGLTLLRGYGLRMAFFFQSAGQLKECFKEKEAVLLDNCEHIYIAPKSLETAERVSKQLGDATITIETANENESRSWQQGGSNGDGGTQINTSTGRNYSEQGRALLRPEEVLQLPEDLVIAFLRGVPPVLAKRVKYYADPAFGTAAKAANPIPPALWWAVVIGASAAMAWLLNQK